MTVQELIDKLNLIDDKSRLVVYPDDEYSIDLEIRTIEEDVMSNYTKESLKQPNIIRLS